MTLNSDTRVFIAGCGGMLGRAVYAQFSKCAVMATDIDLNEPWLTFCDVRDYAHASRLILNFHPDLIINLAALTDLEQCERWPTAAWMTNALGAENIGIVAGELGVPYVYISTAGVFDGKQTEYTDFDEPNPLGCYAKSKLYGERWVGRTLKKHFVLRAGWMMGGGAKDKKFVRKIHTQILEGRRTIYAVSDKHGTPTYTIDFAAGIQRVVESGLYGLYNQVCLGAATRFDVACAFVEELGLSHSVRVAAVDSQAFAVEYFALRPASEQLINMKLDARGLNGMRHWRVCLHEYTQTLKALIV